MGLPIPPADYSELRNSGKGLPINLDQLVQWMVTNKGILSVEPGDNGPVGAMCQVSLSVPYEHPTRKDLTGFIYQDVQVPTGQILDKANPKFVSDVIMNLITAVEEERNTHNASEGDEAKSETPATTQLDVRV